MGGDSGSVLLQDNGVYDLYTIQLFFPSSWSTMVADEGNNWTPEWGTTAYASHQKKLFKLHKADNAIQVTINFTHNSLFPSDYVTSGGKCWGFLLWVWVSGSDPNFDLLFCEVKTETTLYPKTTAKRVKNYVRKC
ncbi:hypothetical protein AMECASPLE_037574 [Ameca splendens]|uniref:Uncharacterized protein n=1 Tax=Ameca splendens TaxID=208324 RepID=A0ABV0ZHM4_9TELE